MSISTHITHVCRDDDAFFPPAHPRLTLMRPCAVRNADVHEPRENERESVALGLESLLHGTRAEMGLGGLGAGILDV